jgi:hypothetical protein
MGNKISGGGKKKKLTSAEMRKKKKERMARRKVSQLQYIFRMIAYMLTDCYREAKRSSAMKMNRLLLWSSRSDTWSASFLRC